jgi:hypothetical protein
MNVINSILTTLQKEKKIIKGRKRRIEVTIKIVRLGVRNSRHDSESQPRQHRW